MAKNKVSNKASNLVKAVPVAPKKLKLYHNFNGIYGLDRMQLTPKSLLVELAIWASEAEHQAQKEPLNNYRLQLALTNGEFQKNHAVLYKDLTGIALTLSDAQLPDWQFLLLRISFTEKRGEVFTSLSNGRNLGLEDARSQPINESKFDWLVSTHFARFEQLTHTIFDLAERRHEDAVRVNPAFKPMV
jgi:hypothetical protein